jgi:flagellar export protein FliJ
MKTKFDSVVKIRAQKVEKIENDIKKINSSIAKLKEKINNLNSLLLSLHLPTKGSFSQIAQINSQKNLIRNEIDALNNQIIILTNRKNELLHELKKAKVEFEKMKYLQSEEIKKIIKEIKLKEARELDEIAILLKARDESK